MIDEGQDQDQLIGYHVDLVAYTLLLRFVLYILNVDVANHPKHILVVVSPNVHRFHKLGCYLRQLFLCLLNRLVTLPQLANLARVFLE